MAPDYDLCLADLPAREPFLKRIQECGGYAVNVCLTDGIVRARYRNFAQGEAASLLEGLSACITRKQSPDLDWFAYSLVFSLTAVTAGYVFFKHLEPAFAESI